MSSAATFIELAANSLEAQNPEEAIDFANKAIALEPQNPNAWLLKAKGAAGAGTLRSPRLAEVLVCVRNALKFTPSEMRDEMQALAVNTVIDASNVIYLASKNHLREYANLDGVYDLYLSNTSECIEAQELVLALEPENRNALDNLIEIISDILKGKSYFGHGYSGVHDINEKYRSELNKKRTVYISRLQRIDPSFQPQQVVKETNSACYVATAVSGYESEVVKQLRLFRDTILTKHASGRAFIRSYYERGPALAQACEQHTVLRLASKYLVVLPAYFASKLVVRR